MFVKCLYSVRTKQLENQVDRNYFSLQLTNIDRTTSSCSPFGVKALGVRNLNSIA